MMRYTWDRNSAGHIISPLPCNGLETIGFSIPSVRLRVSSVRLSVLISCAGCIIHMLGWILILLHTIILHNKMMCHEQHPASYAQGQGHILDLNIWMTILFRISCAGCIIHMHDWIYILLHTFIL
jgi:hypothetical protein